MIDVHSHVLPVVDDGSETLSQSLQMLSTCVQQGVSGVILTPHYRNEMKPIKTELVERFNDFCKQVKEANIDVDLYLGQEIYVDENYKKYLQSDKVLTMNGSKYVLVEFDFTKTCDIPEIVYELVAMGFKPIVAHPERYFYVDFDTACEIKSLGGLIQVNAQSVVSKRLFGAWRLVKKMFKHDLVDFVASDAHYMRENNMQKAYERVRKKFGVKMAKKVFCENAKKIIKG